MTELAKCPFCGNEFNVGHKTDCYFRIRGKSDEQREAAWQSRPIEDTLTAENKRLSEAVEKRDALLREALEDGERLAVKLQDYADQDSYSKGNGYGCMSDSDEFIKEVVTLHREFVKKCEGI